MVQSSKVVLKAAIVTVVFASSVSIAFAQGFIKKDSNLPDASHFYRSRQQWQVIDNSPVITGSPGAGGAQAGGPVGMPGANGPAPLPRAGWQPYSQEMPGLSTSLPKVNNGVPPKLTPKDIAAMQARQNKLMQAPKAAHVAPVVHSAPAVEAYTPYKGYSPSAEPAVMSGGSGKNAATNVKGSVLHWARGNH